MAVIMAWIVDFDRRRIGIKQLLWLIPLCIVWTNLHGGVLGGIATFGLAIGGWFVTRARSLKEIGVPRADFRRLFAVDARSTRSFSTCTEPGSASSARR